jgi:hypothetical protein
VALPPLASWFYGRRNRLAHARAQGRRYGRRYRSCAPEDRPLDDATVRFAMQGAEKTEVEARARGYWARGRTTSRCRGIWRGLGGWREFKAQNGKPRAIRPGLEIKSAELAASERSEVEIQAEPSDVFRQAMAVNDGRKWK